MDEMDDDMDLYELDDDVMALYELDDDDMTWCPSPPPSPTPSPNPSYASTSSDGSIIVDKTLPQNYTGEFKIQIVSDLFLDIDNSYNDHVIKPKAPFLALLGNIGRVGDMCRAGRPSPMDSDFAKFLFRQVAQFRIVFFVTGTHESHGGSWAETGAFFGVFRSVVKQRRKKGEEMGEFVLLDRMHYNLPYINHDKDGKGYPVTILGCTQFSFIPTGLDVKDAVHGADFHKIEQWSEKQHNDANVRDLTWLNLMIDSLQQEERRAVVLTHFCPTTDPAFLHPQDVAEMMDCTVAAELGYTRCGRSDVVKAWAWGRTQVNRNVLDGEKRMMSNQRGHPLGPRGLVSGYDEEATLTLPPEGRLTLPPEDRRSPSTWSISSSSLESTLANEWDYINDSSGSQCTTQ